MYTVETIDSNNEHWIKSDFPRVQEAIDYANKLAESYGDMQEVKPYCETSIARWQKGGDYTKRNYISVYPTYEEI